MREASSLEANCNPAPGTLQPVVAQQINLWRLRDKDCVVRSFVCLLLPFLKVMT
jgi:hypothetical protein